MLRYIKTTTSLLAVGLLLPSCGILSGGWKTAEKTDPITSVISTTAAKDFTPDDDSKFAANVKFTCNHMDGQPGNPLNLLVSITGHDTTAKDPDSSVAIQDDSVEFRVDNLGFAKPFQTTRQDSSGSDFVFSFAGPLSASGEIAQRYLEAMKAELQLLSSRPDTAATANDPNSELFQVTAVLRILQQSGSTGDDAIVESTIAKFTDAPQTDSVTAPLLAKTTGNFSWPFDKMTLRFEAGGKSRLINVSLSDRAVRKVADTCGWNGSSAASGDSANSSPSAAPLPPAAKPSPSTAGPMSTPPTPAPTTPSPVAPIPAAPAPAPVGQQVPSSPAVTQATTPPTATRTDFQPSFDCAKASTGPERLICSSPDLAQLDVKLMGEYKQILTNATKGGCPQCRANETAEQRKWISDVRNACSSAQCMGDAYRKRVKQLDDELDAATQD